MSDTSSAEPRSIAIWARITALLLMAAEICLIYLVLSWTVGENDGQLGIMIVGMIIGFVVVFVPIRSLRKVPSDPYTKAIREFLGRPYRVLWPFSDYLGPGWHLFPGFSFLFGKIEHRAEKTNVNMEAITAIAPDGASIIGRVRYTYIPDNLLIFHKSGGHDGVQEILNDINDQEFRQWAPTYENEDGSPGDWMDVISAPDSAISRLADKIVAQEGRRKLTKKAKSGLRNGSAEIVLPNLGVKLNRLNIGQMEVDDPDLKKDAALLARERRQRLGEAEEREFNIESIRDYVNKLDFTPQEARDAHQVARGKADRVINVNEVKISRETRGFLETFGGNVLARILEARAESEGGDDG